MNEKPAHGKKIFSIFFLVLMVIMGLASTRVLFQKAELTEHGKADAYAASSSQDGFGTKFESRVNEVTTLTEQCLTSQNPLAAPLTNLWNSIPGVSTGMGSVVFNGSSAIVRLSNGTLTECCDYCPSHEAQNAIRDFAAWLQGQGIPYVTLIQPDKSDDSITQFPEGVPHGYSRMLEEYKAFLDGNGLPYIDAKQVLLAENEDFYSWFYKTDHHWNVHAAYRMARETAHFLKTELALPAAPSALDGGNYSLTVYPDSFLGSYGRQLGNTQNEDMEIYYPEKDTSFHIEIPGAGVDKTGDFHNTLIDQSRLSTDETSYSAFLYGDFPLVRIENRNCQNGTRILVIKYSFADSLCPYLADTVQYIDMIDPRYFAGSIRSFICNQEKPDAVILCMGVVTADDEKYLQFK